MEAKPMECKPEGGQLEFGSLAKVYNAIATAIKKITEYLRDESLSIVGENKFGDIQLNIDVDCNNIVYDELKKSGVVAYALSEEKPVLEPMGPSSAEYIVTFDPLDGSSVIATNFSVGSIFAVWPNKEKLMGLKGHDILGAMVAVYGPRTDVIYYNDKDKRVDLMKLIRGSWVSYKYNLTIKPTTKLFAPGNLRAASVNKGYKEVIDYWLEKGYTLRYTGAMVPDIYQLFIKGQGIFANIISPEHPAKLRLLYEMFPFAFLAEAAGGKSSDGSKSLLETEIIGYEMKGQVILGSKEEVERLEKSLGKHSA